MEPIVEPKSHFLLRKDSLSLSLSLLNLKVSFFIIQDESRRAVVH